MNRRANGLAIAAIRKALGVRQDALAARVGVAKPYMSQIEHGVRLPPMTTIVRIAAELGVDPDAISYPEPVTSEVPA